MVTFWRKIQIANPEEFSSLSKVLRAAPGGDYQGALLLHNARDSFYIEADKSTQFNLGHVVNASN
jgi:hypothetical protein